MEILQTIREYFGYLAISPTRRMFNLQHILTLILFFQFTIALLAFFFLTATRLIEYVDCFYALLSAPTNILTFSSYVWKSPVIFKLINDVELAIQTRCENPTARAMYQEANDICNKIAKFLYTALVQITIPSVFLIQYLVSFFFYFATDIGEESFRLPFPIEYPFNLKTPHGYTVACLMTFLAFHVIGQSCTCILGFLIGMCSMISTFVLDIKEDLRHLDGSMQKLCDFVKLHYQAKHFVSELNDIYHLIIYMYYLWSILTICDNLLSFQLESVQNSQSPVVWISLAKVFWSFNQIFFFCYFGEQLTAAFLVLNDSIYECDWYLLPVNVQKMMITVMNNSQKTVYLQGMGHILCTLLTFKGIADK